MPAYDANGQPIYLQKVDANGNPVFDANGNPVYVQQVDANGNPVFDANGNPVYVQRLWKTTQVQHEANGGYDNAGNEKAYRVTEDGVTSYYHYGQLEYERYREAAVAGYRSDNQGDPGLTTSKYDANGFLISVDDPTKAENDRSFVNDADGHVLLKRQMENGQVRFLRQLVVDGNVVAVYGQGTNPKKPTDDNGNPKFDDNQGNFDLNFQPITNSYPAPSQGQYSVQAGDTLQTIAQAAYGDSSQWYLIANANGLRGNEDLRVGQTLVIPTSVGGTHNTAETFKPYDPSKIVGDTTPNLPVPQGSGSGGSGALGIILAIIVIVVTVVVTVYTAGATSALLSSEAGLLGSATETFAAGAAALSGGGAVAGAAGVEIGTTAALIGAGIGGAVGSLAGQGLANLFHMQKGIDWTQVALGGIGAGVGAGLGAATSGVAALQNLSGPASWLYAGARSAVANAATQGIAILTHLQKVFDWRSVAASAVGATVGASVGDVANQALGYDSKAGFNFGKSLASGALSGLASGITTAAVRGGKINLVQVATDAFGNALGESIKGALVPGSDAASAYQQRQQGQQSSQTTQEPAPQPELRDSSNAEPMAADEQLDQSANEEAPSEPTTSYTAQRGEGPLAIAANIDPDNRYAVMAYLAATGQMQFDASSNRWITYEGQTYTADLSGLSDDQVAKLDATGRDAVATESAVDARRAAVAEAQAALQAQQEAAANAAVAEDASRQQAAQEQFLRISGNETGPAETPLQPQALLQQPQTSAAEGVDGGAPLLAAGIGLVPGGAPWSGPPPGLLAEKVLSEMGAGAEWGGAAAGSAEAIGVGVETAGVAAGTTGATLTAAETGVGTLAAEAGVGTLAAEAGLGTLALLGVGVGAVVVGGVLIYYYRNEISDWWNSTPAQPPDAQNDLPRIAPSANEGGPVVAPGQEGGKAYTEPGAAQPLQAPGAPAAGVPISEPGAESPIGMWSAPESVAEPTPGRPVNSAGEPYPSINDLRTGEPIPFPEGDLARVPREERTTWDSSPMAGENNDRYKYIKEWYDRGYEDPPGGWAQYDIHHIQPLEFGGTNDFRNLTPVLRTQHPDFTNWWNRY